MGTVSHRAVTSPRCRPAILTALAVAAALAGCGGGQKAPAGPRSVVVSVTPSRTCNRGRPLQAIIRAVTLKQFVEDQYRNIAQLVVSPDDSVLSSFVVFPGVDQAVAIPPPAKGAVAVYFLFTGATGTSWKQLFDSPPSTLHIELGENQIVTPTSTPPAAGKRAPGP
jgi:predicted component of type VI protein secretion system